MLLLLLLLQLLLLLTEVAAAQRLRRRRLMMMTLLIVSVAAICGVGGRRRLVLLPLRGVPGNGLFDLEEGLVGDGAEGRLQPLDPSRLLFQLVLEPLAQSFLLLEAAQVKV